MQPIMYRASLGIAVLLLCGCGNVGSQPSYGDLVVTYNAELETLDRLQKQRAELVAEYERQLQPSAQDAMQALSDVLGTAAGANPLGESDEPLTPDRALDVAVESAERTGQATSDLLEAAMGAATGGDGELTPEQTQLKDAFEKKLAELDAEIEAQQARVDRAREARDAAEAK
jgi:hypothetical protein